MKNFNFSYGMAAGISLIAFIIMIFANLRIFSGMSVMVIYHSNLNLYPPLIFAIIFGVIGRFYEKRSRYLSTFSIGFGIAFIVLVSLWYWFSSGVVA